MNKKKVCLVMPGLGGGGAERVMSILANEFVKNNDLEVHLVLFSKNEIFYDLNEKVQVHSVKFNYKNYPSWVYIPKIFLFLRSALKKIKPNSLLSFNGKFNSFVLLASLWLGINCYVSDRSRPGIKYGFFADFFNPIMYRYAKGIIAQTSQSKKFSFKRTGHKNIIVIPNPIENNYNSEIKKKNIILNVGRFIKSKQQELLIDLFMEINPPGWTLEFVGDGNQLFKCKKKVEEKGFADKIVFHGKQNNIIRFYQESKIFAFTSVSEGFPNALAEAMSAGCACISFNCDAGPADLIDHNVNGFLIEKDAVDQYKISLEKLIKSTKLTEEFSFRSVEKVKPLVSSKISDKYRSFILQEKL